MWNYKCHRILTWLLNPWKLSLRSFLLNLSWHYAHYANGWFVTGPDVRPKFPPDTFFRDKSFWWAVCHAWQHRNREE